MNINAIEKIDFKSIENDTYNTCDWCKWHRQDELCIGTTYYQGLAFFWNYEYRFDLRDASYKNRKKVHDAFLAAGLPLDGESKLHDKIINEIVHKKSSGDY